MCVYLYKQNKYTQYTYILCKRFILDAINHDELFDCMYKIHYKYLYKCIKKLQL